MASEGIPLLLIVLLMGSYIGSTEASIDVEEKYEVTKEGSCLTIPCKYIITVDQTIQLLWFKDPRYDDHLKKFDGTIVYSSTEERPQSPGYAGRVEYITDLKSSMHRQTDGIQCDLRINNLQKTDSGNYSFRYIQGEAKYMSKVLNLTVTDNPCKVHIKTSELNSSLKESDEFIAHCSTNGSCDSPPEWLVHKSGQNPEWTETGEDGITITKLKLNVTWKDDGRILSCRPSNNNDNCQIRNITLSVEYKPKEVNVTVSSKDVKEGDNITLSCNSKGHPNVTVTWFKNDKKVESQKMSDLKFHVTSDDNGVKYYCEANNVHGTVKSSPISMDVKFGPKGVTVKPDNVTNLKEGDELTLKCSVQKSNPAPSRFRWYINGHKQHETRETFINNRVSVAERYKCEADNEIKVVTSEEITVSILYSPRNIKIEGDTNVKVGKTLHLTCKADSNPQPNFSWRNRPGLSFSQLSDNFLYIEKVTTEHAGTYTCNVKNAVGTKSENATVHVLYPPSNLNLAMQSEVREFEVISIICTVQSYPKSQITVTRDQFTLDNTERRQMNRTEHANKLIIFLNVTEMDAGTYECQAKNQEGHRKSKKNLTVLYAPKNVNASFKGNETVANKLTLTCEAHSNPQPSLYVWKKRINGQFKEVMQRQQILHFDSLAISDSGQYVCIAQNSIGNTKSPPLDIKVKYSPIITIVHNRTAFIQWDLPVYLSCNADAYPPVTNYNWYREKDNTTVLSDQQNYTVIPQNPGMYYCTASNIMGISRSKQITLFVSSYSKVLKIILPIIFLLILIVVVIFLIRRTIIKEGSDQQSGTVNRLCFFPAILSRSSTMPNIFLLGSRNNTQENLTMEDPRRQIHQSHPTAHSQDPTRGQDPPRPKPDIQTVYSAIKLPQIKQERRSPKQQPKIGYMDNDVKTSTINYVTLDFSGQNEPTKRAPESSAVYATVSKNKQARNSQSDVHDYENVSSACLPKHTLTNMEWDSDTSEEDEVNYTAVSCPVKPAVKDLTHKQKSCFSSSSSDEDDRTEYSVIKAK